MISTQKLAESFAMNLSIIQMQTKGLSHQDSLVQTPYNINTLNWVLGHIAVYRDRILQLLGERPLLSEVETKLYQRDSQPLDIDDEKVIWLERMLEVLARGQEIISERLAQLTDADLAQPVQVGDRSMPVSDRLFFLYFHDTYHTGQTDLLRQVAGKNDKII